MTDNVPWKLIPHSGAFFDPPSSRACYPGHGGIETVARPEVLLIAADGPRGDVRCAEVREQVLNRIDWPCRVETRFLDEQQSCRRVVSCALDWAFGLHEQLIILEDDCVPHPFLCVCAAMLDRFKDEPEVMQICA